MEEITKDSVGYIYKMEENTKDSVGYIYAFNTIRKIL